MTKLNVLKQITAVLRLQLRSVAANVRARKSLTGRQRRRALMIVSSLRLALDDGWSLIPLKGCKSRPSKRAMAHLLQEMRDVHDYLSGSQGSKFWKAVGEYQLDKLEPVLDEATYWHFRKVM